MDLLLFARLFFSLFSLKRDNMRRFSWKRLFAALLLFPLFIVNMTVNRLFMLLDYVFFFPFLWKKIDRSAFIVAVPRSGTTFLFHKLAENHTRFTAMKLWEIAYAPAITQKYLVLGVLWLDRKIGSPLKKIVLRIEDKMLGNFKKIHHMSLNLPEEDEAILLWNYATVYLNFFYMDTTHFDDYFRFDDCLSDRKRRRIMRWYYRQVQRHNFVFNRTGQKIFLSKNPAFMSKIKTLHEFFPNAVMLNINRCPSRTIPSTMNLSNAAYSFFTAYKPTESINERTKRVVIDWYKMAHQHLKLFGDQCVEIDFYKLVKGDQATLQNITSRLQVPYDVLKQDAQKDEKEHRNKTEYPKLSAEELTVVLEEIPFMKPYAEGVGNS